MNRFIVTFMQRHPLRDHWVEVEAEDQTEARVKAFDVLGDRWAFMYEAEKFDSTYFPGGRVGRTIE